MARRGEDKVQEGCESKRVTSRVSVLCSSQMQVIARSRTHRARERSEPLVEPRSEDGRGGGFAATLGGRLAGIRRWAERVDSS